MSNSATPHKLPVLTVDVIIANSKGEVLLIRRGHKPYAGMWCLPGGMVDPGETVQTAAVREVKQETRLEVSIAHIHGVYSAPGRDPRGNYVSITLVADEVQGEPELTEEALEWKWMDPRKSIEMAFDHARILKDFATKTSTNAVLA